MELFDFTYWTSLNESQKSYYVFEIPIRRLTELDEEYIRLLTELFNENSNIFSYTISPTKGRREISGEITIEFKSEKDELLSAIYGDTTDFKIDLVLPGSSTYHNGQWKAVRSEDLAKRLKGTAWQSTLKKTHFDQIEVVLAILPSDLEKCISATSRMVNGIYSSSDVPAKPTPDDFLQAQENAINKSVNSKIIDTLTDKINEYVRYYATINLLNAFMKSTSTPDIEEVKKSFSDRLTKIKSLNAYNDEDLKEILSFQKDLLSNASEVKIEQPATTDSLIEVFRILLDKVGDVKTIKKELAKIKD